MLAARRGQSLANFSTALALIKEQLETTRPPRCLRSAGRVAHHYSSVAVPCDLCYAARSVVGRPSALQSSSRQAPLTAPSADELGRSLQQPKPVKPVATQSRTERNHGAQRQCQLAGADGSAASGHVKPR